MKLLFIIKSLSQAGGGAERVLADVVSALADRAHQVIVASFDPPESRDFYAMPETVARMRLGVGEIDAPTRARELVGRIRALRRLVRDVQPDVVIGFMHSAYVPLGLALAGTRVPAVASEHIIYPYYRDRPVERALLNLAAWRFDAFTAISAPIRDGFPPHIRARMAVIPNPVANRDLTLADPVGGKRKTILCVGRLFAQKSHATLIAAFARIADDVPDWSVRLIGEGPLRGELEAQIAALGMANRIALPGSCPEIAREYQRAQLFVMPSLFESFGLATAEALAHGLPAIGFADCPGTNDLIVDGENGRLVDGADRVAALAAALAEAMRSDALRWTWGANGPQSIARFGVDAVADQWEELLAKVAAARAR